MYILCMDDENKEVWRCNFNVPGEWKERIKEYAKEKGFNISELVRDYFRSIIDKKRS